MGARGAFSANGDDATVGHDLRFWRSPAQCNWRTRLLGKARLAFLPIISATILFAWQGLITRVQYFQVVSTAPHSTPITTTIAKFVRKTFGFALPGPASAYEAEMQMSASALLDRWSPLVETASKRFGVPQAWIRTVMRMESGGRTMSSDTQPITSRAGAMGLMQVMPGTYREMRWQYGLGANAYDPHDNVFAGAAYLRWLHAKYGFPAMFAVYNDGPGHFEDRIAHGEALPAETRNYASRIAATLGGGGTAGSALHGRFVKFTRPNGTVVSINAAAVTSVRAALAGEYAPGVATVITVAQESQGVRENLAAVKAALNGRGARAQLASLSSQHRLRLAQFGRARRISVSYSMGG